MVLEPDPSRLEGCRGGSIRAAPAGKCSLDELLATAWFGVPGFPCSNDAIGRALLPSSQIVE
jgi:hypothetical protein